MDSIFDGSLDASNMSGMSDAAFLTESLAMRCRLWYGIYLVTDGIFGGNPKAPLARVAKIPYHIPR